MGAGRGMATAGPTPSLHTAKGILPPQARTPTPEENVGCFIPPVAMAWPELRRCFRCFSFRPVLTGSSSGSPLPTGCYLPGDLGPGWRAAIVPHCKAAGQSHCLAAHSRTAPRNSPGTRLRRSSALTPHDVPICRVPGFSLCRRECDQIRSVIQGSKPTVRNTLSAAVGCVVGFRSRGARGGRTTIAAARSVLEVSQ